MRKIIPVAVVGAAVVAVPLGIGLVGHVHTTSTAASTATETATLVATPVPSGTPAHSAIGNATAGAAHTFVGPSTDMQWGPVQVTIVVKGKLVTDLSATAPTERSRSAFINGQAVPMLRQEVLQAKTVANIKNIYGISGATLTSEAFYQSLLEALTSAHLM